MGCGASSTTKTSGMVKEDALERELQQEFQDKNSVDLVMHIAMKVNKCVEMDTIYGDIFEKLTFALNLAAKITPYAQIGKFTLTFSVLSNAIQKIVDALNVTAKSMEDENTYSELQMYQDSEIATKAFGLEKAILNISAYMREFEKQKKSAEEKHAINTLEDKIPINDIVSFLGKMQAKTGELMLKPDVITACRASAYVNLYFRLAILRRMVLWQVFLLKHTRGSDKSSTQGVFAMINESQKNDLEMARLVTEPSLEKAVFHFVFHPTENINFSYFLKIHDQEGKIPDIAQEICIKDHDYILRMSYSRDLKMQVHSDANDDYVSGTKDNSDGCKFTFEPVENRGLDNIFYLRSTRWLKYYVYARSDKFCYSVKDKPGIEGQWKLIRLGSNPPEFIISPVMWSGWFLTFEKGFWPWSPMYLKCIRDINKLKRKGLWEICEV